MTTRLTWTASPSAACLHAAESATAERLPVGAPTEGAAAASAAKFAESAAALRAFLNAEHLSPRPFFRRLVPTACEIESNRALAHTALTKMVGRARADALAERVAGLIGDCESSYFAAFPRLKEELELRYRPLRELWETRGPGLLAAVGRATDRRLVPDEARIAAVLPLGSRGGGWAAAPSNTVVFEMVLADPIAELPETVRLGWLLSRLNFDLPDFAEVLPSGSADDVSAWGMLPPVLEAAAELDMVRRDDDGSLLATAAEAWIGSAPNRDDGAPTPERLAAVIGWWQTAHGRSTPWTVKLAALAQLLTEA